MGPTGLVVMVLTIIAFTIASIVIELVINHGKSYAASVDVLEQIPGAPNEYQVVFHVTNKGTRAGRPDVCEVSLLDFRGERVGTASVRLRTAIQPGQTQDELSIATAASRPVNGQVTCRSLEPD
jgi:FAD synthase